MLLLRISSAALPPPRKARPDFPGPQLQCRTLHDPVVRESVRCAVGCRLLTLTGRLPEGVRAGSRLSEGTRDSVLLSNPFPLEGRAQALCCGSHTPLVAAGGVCPFPGRPNPGVMLASVVLRKASVCRGGRLWDALSTDSKLCLCRHSPSETLSARHPGSSRSFCVDIPPHLH